MVDEMTTITRLMMTMLTMMMVMSMLLISLLLFLQDPFVALNDMQVTHAGLLTAAKCTEAECNTGCYQLQLDLQIRSEARGEAGSLGVGVCGIRQRLETIVYLLRAHVFRTS